MGSTLGRENTRLIMKGETYFYYAYSRYSEYQCSCEWKLLFIIMAYRYSEFVDVEMISYNKTYHTASVDVLQVIETLLTKRASILINIPLVWRNKTELSETFNLNFTVRSWYRRSRIHFIKYKAKWSYIYSFQEFLPLKKYIA